MKSYVLLPIVGVLLGSTLLLFAQDAASEKAPGFVMPEGKTAAELVEAVQKQLAENRPRQGSSQEVVTQYIAEASVFLRDMGDKIIAMKPEAAILQDAYMMKFQGLAHLANENDPKDVKNVEEFLDEIDKVLPDTQLAKVTRAMDLERKATVFIDKESTEEGFQKLLKEVKKLIAQKPVDFLPHIALMFLEVARHAEDKLERKGLTEKICVELVADLKAVGDESLLPIIKRIEGAKRRFPGQEIKIEGITLGGEKFDVKSFRGKVVLIDFFASWCQPCIVEIPNILDAYEKFHQKGFEVVSIGVDSGAPNEVRNLQELVESKKIPWTVLSDELTVKEKLPSIAEYYNVDAIPDMFLIDKEGKVAELNVRGPKLIEALEKLLK